MTLCPFWGIVWVRGRIAHENILRTTTYWRMIVRALRPLLNLAIIYFRMSSNNIYHTNTRAATPQILSLTYGNTKFIKVNLSYKPLFKAHLSPNSYSLLLSCRCVFGQSFFIQSCVPVFSTEDQTILLL